MVLSYLCFSEWHKKQQKNKNCHNTKIKSYLEHKVLSWNCVSKSRDKLPNIPYHTHSYTPHTHTLTQSCPHSDTHAPHSYTPYYTHTHVRMHTPHTHTQSHTTLKCTHTLTHHIHTTLMRTHTHTPHTNHTHLTHTHKPHTLNTLNTHHTHLTHTHTHLTHTHTHHTHTTHWVTLLVFKTGTIRIKHNAKSLSDLEITQLYLQHWSN